VAVALLFRLLLPIRRQWQMRFDVKQAQKVQQVILPEAWRVLRSWLSRAIVTGDITQRFLKPLLV
jgi:hypothetical protein